MKRFWREFLVFFGWFVCLFVFIDASLDCPDQYSDFFFSHYPQIKVQITQFHIHFFLEPIHI